MTDPVPDGYASNIPDPVIEDPGTLSWWQDQYAAILTHLKTLVESGKVQEAYKEIPLLMNESQDYTTNGQNVEVADKSNFDNTIGRYINAIQEDFDQYSSGVKDPTASDPVAKADVKYAKDAQYAESKIQELMDKYPEYAKALGDVTSQLKAIFGETTDSGKTPQELANYWAELWTVPNPSPPSKDALTGPSPLTAGGDTPFQGTSPVSNAINASRNDVESQNTILNSQMQTYSKEASRDLAFEQDCYRAEMDMIKTPVTAAKNAAS